MDKFQERESAFEAKYKLDQELEFRVGARRVKLFGLWVAERLGLGDGDEAKAYALGLVGQAQRGGYRAALEKATRDLKGRGLDRLDVAPEFERLNAVARKQIMDEVAERFESLEEMYEGRGGKPG